MGERKRKEIQEYKVDEKTRTVKAYVKTLSDTAEKTIELYKKMGYTVIMLDKEKPKPRTKQRIGTKEMKLYLKGKIDDKIYKKMVEKIDNKEKFFEIKSWLKEELQKWARNNNKKYVPVNTIIQVEMDNAEVITKANAKEYVKNNALTEDEENKEEE